MASAVIASGKASIEIDPLETEAHLVFVPGSDGDGWDAAAVHKIASDKNIRNHPDPKTLEAFILKAARAKNNEPMVLPYCAGLKPEPPVAEKVNWEPLPVPADMLPFQKETIENAGAPEIFRIRIERVKHEKKVKKPGALPFMPVKEEIEVVWEKKEIREKAEVDPSVLEIKYANKGEKLGTISPSVPGKSGKSIFGRPIPPPLAADETCLLGNGLARDKNVITAQLSGFLRIGENWADLVPLSGHSNSITTGTDGITLFFNFHPGDKRFAVPTAEEILAAAVAQGAAAETLVSPGELNAAIAKAIETGEPLEAFALFRPQEAEARVDINSEKTRAVLYLRKGLAGASPLGMKAISQALSSSGVRGFDLEKLKADIKAFMEGKDLVLCDYVLAEGTPSTRGRDREIEIIPLLLSDEEKKPILARVNEWKERESLKAGGFDFFKASGAAFVEKDSNVARIRSGSDGENGKDIFGNVIPGLPGNDPDIILAGGLELQGTEIKASTNGLAFIETSDKSFHAMVIDYQDARIGVRISDDTMEAAGDFFREEGAGVPLTIQNVKKVLNTLGVLKGIDWQEIEKACYYTRTIGSVRDFILARGMRPLARGASEIKWLVPLNLPEGSGEVSSMQIKAGTPILEMSEPVIDGRPGYNVKGEEIPIEQGDASVYEHDDSIRELPLGGASYGKGRRFVAARSGELKFDGKNFEISSVTVIEGNAEGKIKFSGEVKITGNVLPGCVINSGSHVNIEGMAQEALISAGGKATVELGFKGGGKGILSARAGIEASFVERASVMTVGDIYLKKGSILSVIKTNGKLYIAAENGRLTGGICQARNGVDTTELGSEKGVRTELSFGQDYLVKDQIGSCEEEILKTRLVLGEAEQKIKDLLKKNLPLPEDLKSEKIRLVKILEQCNLRLFTLREKFEEHYESEIRCRGTVFPGVVIESHNRYYEIKQKHSRVVFFFDQETGTIKEKPIE